MTGTNEWQDRPDGTNAPAGGGLPGPSASPDPARVYLPVPLQRGPVDVTPVHIRPLLPVRLRRAALAARNAARNPTVVASVTALATVAAQAGLRLLEAQQATRSTAPKPITPPPADLQRRAATYVRITEIRSVVVEVRDV